MKKEWRIDFTSDQTNTWVSNRNVSSRVYIIVLHFFSPLYDNCRFCFGIIKLIIPNRVPESACNMDKKNVKSLLLCLWFKVVIFLSVSFFFFFLNFFFFLIEVFDIVLAHVCVFSLLLYVRVCEYLHLQLCVCNAHFFFYLNKCIHIHAFVRVSMKYV